MENKHPNINLPVWMNKGEPLTLAHASKTWWSRVYQWLTFPLAQIDVDTCDEQLLDLLAYQRDINRFPGESLHLYRLRVKHAFINSQDAGSLAGFERIFKRLDIGKIQQLERQLQYDWDVIVIRINDEQLSRDNDLMMRLVRQYGRTCRRYFFDVLNHNITYTHSGYFECITNYDRAKLKITPTEVIPEKIEVYLLPGEETTLCVRVLPVESENIAFDATSSDEQLVSIKQDNNTLTLKAGDIGEAEITLLTQSGTGRANISVHIVAGAKVGIRLTHLNQPMFYLNNDAPENLWLDWGDGHLTQNFTWIDGENNTPIYPDESMPLNKDYRLTLYNSDDVTFGRAGSALVENRITRLYQISGERTQLSQLLYEQQSLTQIDEHAFNYLPNLKSIELMLYSCKNLTKLPDQFLTGETLIENARLAFYRTGLTRLPYGFLQRSPRLRNIDRMLTYCTELTELEPNMFLVCAERLDSIYGVILGCKKVATDINTVFSAAQYPNITDARSAFQTCTSLTGSGLSFIAKLPNTKKYSTALSGCIGLSDYEDIPKDWK